MRERASRLRDPETGLRRSRRLDVVRPRSEGETIYALAQRLAKRRENAELAPCVADMRRTLGRVRKQSAEAVAKKEAAKAARAAERAVKAAARVPKPSTAA